MLKKIITICTIFCLVFTLTATAQTNESKSINNSSVVIDPGGSGGPTCVPLGKTIVLYDKFGNDCGITNCAVTKSYFDTEVLAEYNTYNKYQQINAAETMLNSLKSDQYLNTCSAFKNFCTSAALAISLGAEIYSGGLLYGAISPTVASLSENLIYFGLSIKDIVVNDAALARQRDIVANLYIEYGNLINSEKSALSILQNHFTIGRCYGAV